MERTSAYSQEEIGRIVVQCMLVQIANPLHTLGTSPKRHQLLSRNLGKMERKGSAHLHHKMGRTHGTLKLLGHKRSNQSYLS